MTNSIIFHSLDFWASSEIMIIWTLTNFDAPQDYWSESSYKVPFKKASSSVKVHSLLFQIESR